MIAGLVRHGKIRRPYKARMTLRGLTRPRSIIDSSLRPKLAYYSIKRELEPVTIAMKRVSIRSTHEAHGTGVEVWACNTTIQAHQVDVVLSSWNIISGALVDTNVILKNVTLESNRSTELVGDAALLPTPPRRGRKRSYMQLILSKMESK